MENQGKKLRLEDINVESFVTSTNWNVDTIKGGWFTQACFPDQTSDTPDNGGGGGTGGVCTQRCGTNIYNCTQGSGGCNSNTACWDATCADGSWCCPPDSMQNTCGAHTCESGCQSCPC